MRNEQLLTSYRTEKGIGRMKKREINELEPYLEKRTGFMWLPQKDTEYYTSEIYHINLQLSQNRRDLMNISDYLLWSIGNFILFFPLGVICVILSVRVREHKHNKDYETSLKISQRTLIMNIFTSVVGICFLVTMLALLINKSSTNF
ncbi:unnamed protein product [Rotaria sp. Silwood1]|nr:unnamed protein product [Rotaria sp. Silwood1]CAF1603621.1 unnamed protein product [Rotaria sp. Silwood1]CAF3662566.1 unnamed protein product [Rotaria sp. Silwood1]CAF4610733.1 unnamed protein product [Rotaria sp. Silwood1]